jgi:hypothetical protein
MKVFLKKFGIREVNRYIEGYRVGNYYNILYMGDWHYVPEEDIDVSQ